MQQFDNLEEMENNIPDDSEENGEILLSDDIDDDVDERLEDVPEGSNGARGFFEYVETFCYALVLMIVLLLFVFRMVTVDGASMQHTLHDQDKLIISNLFYTPKTGDIVVINPESHSADQAPIIKRVIATAGQTVFIDYENWEVFVDGVKLDEPYIEPMHKEYQEMWGRDVGMVKADNDTYNAEFTVSDGMVFVMGDNRNNSRDSRSSLYGEMNENRILGRVMLRISPVIGFVE